MSKYNSIKYLKKTKARISHICECCNEEIKKGEIYYPESVGRINAPGVKLRKFCMNCYKKYGDKLLIEQ
jgi:hypothetical protein